MNMLELECRIIILMISIIKGRTIFSNDDLPISSKIFIFSHKFPSPQTILLLNPTFSSTHHSPQSIFPVIHLHNPSFPSSFSLTHPPPQPILLLNSSFSLTHPSPHPSHQTILLLNPSFSSTHPSPQPIRLFRHP